MMMIMKMKIIMLFKIINTCGEIGRSIGENVQEVSLLKNSWIVSMNIKKLIDLA